MPPTVVDITAMSAEPQPALATEAAPSTALAELYEHYGDAVMRFCAGRLRNRSNIDDACLETFLRARQYGDTFRPGERVWPWLATIAANVCTDLNRSEGREVPTARPSGIDDAPSAYDEVLLRQHQALVAEAMAQMPPRDRNLLYLRDVEGWSLAALAAREDRTVASIRGILWRAHANLRHAVVAVARERHWPLPAAIALVWNRLRGRAVRARTRIDTAMAQASRYEGFLSPLTGETAMRLGATGMATLAVVLPMTTGPANATLPGDSTTPVAVLEEKDAPGNEPGSLVIPDTPSSRGALSGVSDEVAPQDNGEKPAADDELTEDGTADLSATVPTSPEPPPADAPLETSTSDGEIRSENGEHTVTSPSGELAPSDDAPGEVSEVRVYTGGVKARCPAPEDRSATGETVCEPVDEVTGDGLEGDVELGSDSADEVGTQL